MIGSPTLVPKKFTFQSFPCLPSLRTLGANTQNIVSYFTEKLEVIRWGLASRSPPASWCDAQPCILPSPLSPHLRQPPANKTKRTLVHWIPSLLAYSSLPPKYRISPKPVVISPFLMKTRKKQAHFLWSRLFSSYFSLPFPSLCAFCLSDLYPSHGYNLTYMLRVLKYVSSSLCFLWVPDLCILRPSPKHSLVNTQQANPTELLSSHLFPYPQIYVPPQASLSQ